MEVSTGDGNVKEIVPLLCISSMEQSLRYYVDGLGFTLKNKWVVDGKVRWCWLALGGAALMLQESHREGHDSWVPHGEGRRRCVALLSMRGRHRVYREVTSRGIAASEPQVGNAMWVTSLADPDGYRIEFESPTDTAEETKLSEVKV